jgi:hypothetical protein
MAQSIVKRGSVVLIRYPFTDLPGRKSVLRLGSHPTI